MDLIKEIAEQISQININGHTVLLDQLLNHLERAETYYRNGQDDQQYYNDVIYRSNQAYEGALKEAYRVLTAKNDDELNKASLFDIENHLEKSNIFKSRVLELFRNYRKNWRNTSTHNFNLIFDEKEAFIALMNVSSFTYLLLKQIQEQIAFQKERDTIHRDQDVLAELKRIAENDSETMADRVIKILEDFSLRNKDIISTTGMMENELLGKIHGFLSEAFPNYTIIREPELLSGTTVLRPDMLLEYKGQKIFLEVKRSLQKTPIHFTRMRSYYDQMIRYLLAAKLQEGIIYIARTVNGPFEVKHERFASQSEGKQYVVYALST